MATTVRPDVHTFEHHWQDEADAAFLYRILAAAESDPRKKDIYARLAEVEDRHVVVWGNLMAEHGHPPKPFRAFLRLSENCLARDFSSRCCSRKKAAR